MNKFMLNGQVSNITTRKRIKTTLLNHFINNCIGYLEIIRLHKSFMSPFYIPPLYIDHPPPPSPHPARMCVYIYNKHKLPLIIIWAFVKQTRSSILHFVEFNFTLITSF